MITSKYLRLTFEIKLNNPEENPTKKLAQWIANPILQSTDKFLYDIHSNEWSVRITKIEEGKFQEEQKQTTQAKQNI